jgi:hypothetical protein
VADGTSVCRRRYISNSTPSTLIRQLLRRWVNAIASNIRAGVYYLLGLQEQQDFIQNIYEFHGIEEVSRANHLFGGQNEWFEHEAEFHRRSWNGNICNHELKRNEFKLHIQQKHTKSFKVEHFDVVISRCERPSNLEQQCPFCDQVQSRPRFRDIWDHICNRLHFLLCYSLLRQTQTRGRWRADPDSED